MKTCKCGDSYLNTGFTRCPTKKMPAQIVLVPDLGSDGTVNRINVATFSALSAAAQKTYFVDKVNAVEPEDRWYPLQVKNVTGSRAASDFETFTDKSKSKIRKGIRNFSAVVADGSPQLESKLEGWGCSEAFGIFIIDVEGNINGMELEEGYLDPYSVDVATWDILGVWAEGDVSTKVQIGFDFSSDMNDGDERMLAASDLAPNNMLQIFKYGLRDIFAEFGTNSTTSIVVSLVSKDGSLLNPTGEKGLVIADFVSSVTAATSKVRNTTTNADVTITSISVAADGFTYTINFVAQTSLDEIVVAVKKNGFDNSQVALTPTSIP